MKNKNLELNSSELKNILRPITPEQMEELSRKDLIILLRGEQSIRFQMEAILEENKVIETKRLELEGQFIVLKSRMFGPKSEKSPKKNSPKKEKKERSKQVKDLGDRYPNLPRREDQLTLEKLPSCPCCQKEMQDSGLTEDSQYLEVIPKKYIIVIQRRAKYRCSSCHDKIITTPGPRRMIPGSSYSDQFILDAALSKFCDLLPIDRQVAMARRNGVENLPANSLIQIVHRVAEFVEPAQDKNLEQILDDQVVRADETPHRMLEENDGKSWYLWGISSSRGCHFQVANTRSGTIAGELLKNSQCEFLMSDVFSGYSTAVKIVNEHRNNLNLDKAIPKLISVHCNAHARRKFKDIESISAEEAEIFLDAYKEIYKLESQVKETTDTEEKLNLREQMRPYFEKIKENSQKNLIDVSEKSVQARAYKYFLKNYDSLTFFIKNIAIPIDNNMQESLLRNPVIGRKTWYGTHSVRGAKTTATLFSLVESCKMLKINPREYFSELIKEIHEFKNYMTPYEFKNRQKNPEITGY